MLLPSLWLPLLTSSKEVIQIVAYYFYCIVSPIMEGVFSYMDTIVVPLSLFITIGYHAYLWHIFKNTPFLTTIGINFSKRRLLFQHLQQGDAKEGTLAVQSLRNSLMEIILTATITAAITMVMAALSNNAYNANNLFTKSVTSSTLIFGLRSAKIIVLKFGLTTIFLLISFLCSSIAVGNIIDANFLINSTLGIKDELLSSSLTRPDPEYTLKILERGFVLGLVGSRLLCVAFTLLLWMFSPVLVALSSVVLVWGLYELDFVSFSINSQANKR